MTLFLLAGVVVGLAMAAMAVGAILSNRCLRGSCGGADVVLGNGQSLSCDACPRRRQMGAAPLRRS